MKSRLNKVFAAMTVGSVLPATGLADSTIMLHVDVKNAPARASSRIPASGDFTFSFGHNRARVVAPNGIVWILDFDNRLVSELDPGAKTFFQMKISDYLALGENLPSSLSNRYSEQVVAKIAPTVGQDSRSILGQKADAYDLDLEATLSRQNRQGGGGGRRHMGGIFGGGGGGGGRSSSDSAPYLSSAGCKLQGELWTSSTAIGDIDSEQLAVAETCALMGSSPGLRGLTDRLRRAKLTVLEADYAVSILDSSGNQPANPPVVSAIVASVQPAHFDATTFTIPAEYTKIGPPDPALGTSN